MARSGPPLVNNVVTPASTTAVPGISAALQSDGENHESYDADEEHQLARGVCEEAVPEVGHGDWVQLLGHVGGD
jgi:hypothetical protein